MNIIFYSIVIIALIVITAQLVNGQTIQLSLTKEEALANGKWVFDGNGFEFEPFENDTAKQQHIERLSK